MGLSNVTDQWRYVIDGLTPLVDPFKSDIYQASHSSTPGSVMNYDEHIGVLEDADSKTRMEPDCWPQPLDILAIFPLYQATVP